MYSIELEKEENEIQKLIFLCHSHESGNPGVEDNKRKIDSRFRGNDITGRGNDIIEKKSVTHNLCITSRLTGKLGNWITNILYAVRYTLYDMRYTKYDIRKTRDDIR